MMSFQKIIFILLILGTRAQAASENSIIIWDGLEPSVFIATGQLEALGAYPFEARKDQDEKGSPLRWFRLRVDNRTSSAATLQLNSLDPATHRLVLVEPSSDLANPSPQEMISRRDRSPDAEFRRMRMDLTLAPGMTTYYLGVSSFLDMANFQLIPSTQREIEDSRFTFLAGLILGGIAIMMVSALLLFATLGHQMLLVYAFYSFTLLPLLLNLSGLFGSILSPQLTDWFERHMMLTAQMAILGLLELSMLVLHVRYHKRRFYLILRGQSLAALGLVAVAACLDTDRSLLFLSQISLIVALISLVTIGLRLSWQDIRSARFYVGGLGLFLLGSTVTLLGSLDINTDPLDPVLCIMTGAALQLLLMPFGIQDRLRSLTMDKDEKEYKLQEAQALLQVLTHDLSGPLFIIQSMAELQSGKAGLEPKAQKSFEKISKAALSAQSILKVVKELEAIEAGKLDLVLKPVPLLATIHSTLDVLKSKADAKQIQITLQADIPATVMVLAERTVLENTIFHNILMNAIKFSKAENRIDISIVMTDQEKIAVQIKDHGIGIPKTLILKLFSHSCKTSRKGTVGEKGTGLGLPLAQRYVQKFGGCIEVKSQAEEDFPDDHWTQFTVTLKRAG
ncbi:MAG TPA: sensor histidine kinase [Oligoflexus sp.]|uniref:sensor histidine kinase n=1 Tax=Oligoflexus sp. TaxID=1971216 RepID=UPI002D3E1672|nr:sensor histidine kinase [Oligoflexus sp.]HYX34470.1 sensor histidine kinase [Oligoflexus sp.]